MTIVQRLGGSLMFSLVLYSWIYGVLPWPPSPIWVTAFTSLGPDGKSYVMDVGDECWSIVVDGMSSAENGMEASALRPVLGQEPKYPASARKNYFKTDSPLKHPCPKSP